MKKFTVEFHDMDDKALFLDKTNSLDCEVDILYGSHVGDGKSAIYVLNLPVNTGISVGVFSDEIDISKVFAPWIVEGSYHA